MLSFNEYQKKAKTTDKYPSDVALGCYMLGLCSEAGEVAGKMKKIARDNIAATHSVKKEFIYELGDCLWYIAMIAAWLGYSMEDVAKYNIEKLADRAQRGKIGGSGDKR